MSAVGRLGKELRRRRPEDRVPAPTSQHKPVAEASGEGYGEAHLKTLMRMHAEGAMRQHAETSDQREAAALFARGRSMLEAEAFERAVEAFAALVALEPSRPVYEGYRLYAFLRAHPKAKRQPETISSLRTILREYLNDDQHRAFAYYALGHAAFAEDNDTTAEKLFRRAAELDRKNKDAVRYLKILERRRDNPPQPQKIFGIELTRKKS